MSTVCHSANVDFDEDNLRIVDPSCTAFIMPNAGDASQPLEKGQSPIHAIYAIFYAVFFCSFYVVFGTFYTTFLQFLQGLCKIYAEFMQSLHSIYAVLCII